jgi:hypothetical protein
VWANYQDGRSTLAAMAAANPARFGLEILTTLGANRGMATVYRATVWTAATHGCAVTRARLCGWRKQIRLKAGALALAGQLSTFVAWIGHEPFFPPYAPR